MKLDSIVFYKLKSRSWVSPWTEHAYIITGNGVETTASLFYAKKLHTKDKVYGQYSLGLQYTHELYIMAPGLFLKFPENEVDDVISALAKAGYLLEDG